MKKLFLLLLALPLVATAFAQGVSLSGRVVDASDESTLPGAHLMLSRGQDATERHAITDDGGVFAFDDLRPGPYRLIVSFLGYQSDTLLVRMTGQSQDLGTLRLESSAVNLERVEIQGKTVTGIQLGDTTQFNAGAFKVNPDASAEDLVKKMPGVVVEGGQIQAQGENVREVLVDGKPFFGNDPAAALRNLPAEVIDKIQVFDQQSEQAQFTGFNDGETTKTINIITRVNMRSGQFGKVYAGYGTDDHYHAGGNVNFFDGDARLSVIGQSNDINQQNFATEDLLGVVGSSGGRRGPPGGRGGRGGRGGGDIRDFLVSQQNGISQTHALGLNYSDNWGKKVEVAGSYFFNHSDNDALQMLSQQYLTEEGLGQLYNEDNQSNTKNTNHRFNMRLEYEMNDRNSIIFRPRLSVQQNDGVETTFGQTFLSSDLLNQTDYRFSPELSAVDFSSDLLYRHRFAKDRRTFSLRLETAYNRNQGESFLFSRNTFFNDMILADTLDQFSDLLSDGWTFSSDATYTEPVGKKGMFQVSYETSWQFSDSDKETFDFEESSQDYSLINLPLSNTFESTYLTQELGTGYRVRGEKTMLNARLNYQWARLDNENVYPAPGQLERTFSNILPSAFLMVNFSRMKNLRAGYRTRTSPPSIDQLQDVVDNSNPLQLRTGNPDLKQNYEHRLFARYSSSKPENSTVFFALVSGSLTQNYVGNSTLIASRDTLIREGVLLPRGSQLSLPVNLDGYWNVRSFLTYGFPVKWLQSNLNLNLSGTFTRQPGLINGETNYANNTQAGIGLVLSSNISPNFDFTISSRTNYNLVRNSLNTRLDDEYINQSSEVGFNWIFGPAIVFRTNLSHQLFSGLSEGFDQNFWLWNASIGKKFLKEDRGELRLTIFDLLKQNTSIQRNVTDVYIEDSRTEVLQQYFMLTFMYNIRNFGTPPARPEREDDEPRRHWGPGRF